MGYGALLFLILTFTELVFLSALTPLDTAFYNWVEAHRSCTLDYLGVFLKHWPIIMFVALGFLALAWLCVERRWAEARHAFFVAALGGFLSELLKTAFERARPSALLLQATGNSFPSGHISGAVLIAGVLGFLLVRQRWTGWAKLGGAFVLAGFVSVITWQRLYMAHHWLSDAVGTILLISAWLCLALPRPDMLSFSRRHVLVWAGLLGCYQIFYFFPATRLALPSVLTTRGEPLFTLSFNEPFSSVLFHGAWGGKGHETNESTAWIRRGEASIEVPFSTAQAYTLRLAAHPFWQTKAFRCYPLDVFVNQQPAGRLLLYNRGWREYVVHIDPTWVVSGANMITFRAGDDFPEVNPDQRTVEFLYLYLFAEK